MKTIKLLGIAVLLATIAHTSPVWAQENIKVEKFKENFVPITFDSDILGSRKDFSMLPKDQIKLLLRHREIPITRVIRNPQVNITIAVDVSPSMKSDWPSIQKGLLGAVKYVASYNANYYFPVWLQVYAFDEQALYVGNSTSLEDLRSKLESLKPQHNMEKVVFGLGSSKDSHMFTAIYSSLNTVANNIQSLTSPRSPASKNVLIVITDGEDNDSRARDLQKLREKLVLSGTQLYVLAVPDFVEMEFEIRDNRSDNRSAYITSWMTDYNAMKGTRAYFDLRETEEWDKRAFIFATRGCPTDSDTVGSNTMAASPDVGLTMGFARAMHLVGCDKINEERYRQPFSSARDLRELSGITEGKAFAILNAEKGTPQLLQAILYRTIRNTLLVGYWEKDLPKEGMFFKARVRLLEQPRQERYVYLSKQGAN